ncbi:Tetratricopeptide TPR_2 repeat protein [Rippkaea orientalis PCC 8801]|uniref:Tetratricopeptide TPR_2 repeat protein n=1 Tax=Rippkaea orientalis (strain PCC 8801 / RF-1) TaxID=41431 RepID=B7JYM7_RIPO1|nr:tetratricopeptide repeat protein [Rippkaea orientalis]ACK64897.1 Tetratricopeptide TPR_2 repeat protein [Rippkaea orientalis PCC 8801]
MKNQYHALLKFGLILLISLTCFIQPVKATTQISANVKDSELFDQGIEHIENNDYEQALSDLTQVINLGSALTPSAYSNRCLVNLQLNNNQAAKLDCTEAIKLNPNNTEAYLNRGLAEYRLGNYEQALEQYQKVVERDADDYRSHYNQGLVNFALERYEIALQNYEKALASTRLISDSAKGIIYYDRALVQLKLDNIQQAIADFTEAINLDNLNDKAYYNRAYAYQKIKNYRAAIADFSEVIALNHDFTPSYLNRGKLYYILGRYQTALKDFKIALNQFKQQGKMTAYQQTLALINQFKQNFSHYHRSLYA